MATQIRTMPMDMLESFLMGLIDAENKEEPIVELLHDDVRVYNKNEYRNKEDQQRLSCQITDRMSSLRLLMSW